MRCFDCADADRQTEAVGVCDCCGAGVCREHTIVAERTVHRQAAMGQASSAYPARRILCHTCREAKLS